MVPILIAKAIREIVTENGGAAMTDDQVLEAWEKFKDALPLRLSVQLTDEELDG